jgi:outer membrane protein
MKKIFMMALAAACALTACTTNGGAQGETAEGAAREVGSSDIAYVQVEAVLAQCDLYLKEGVALQEKTQKAQESWAKKERALQAEYNGLVEKVQKALITSRDAQAKEQAIQKRLANYQQATQKEAQTLEEENLVFTNRVQDLVMRAVQEVNADKKYKLIINANSLMDADTTLNITAAVLAKANELYAQEKDEVKAE